MQRYLDEDLAELKERLLTMASHAEWAITRSVKAFVERDDTQAQQVTIDDTEIDRLEIEVDELSVNLLAKAPLASDLRSITVAMKVSHDLERVGDEATTIARRVLELNLEPPLKACPDLPRIAFQALGMLNSALNAFVNRNTDRARLVIERDRATDALNTQIQLELASWMIEEPATIARCLNLMVVSKCLERVADHAVNIAEEVVYLYEGRDIRHSGLVQRQRS